MAGGSGPRACQGRGRPSGSRCRSSGRLLQRPEQSRCPKSLCAHVAGMLQASRASMTALLVSLLALPVAILLMVGVPFAFLATERGRLGLPLGLLLALLLCSAGLSAREGAPGRRTGTRAAARTTRPPAHGRLQWTGHADPGGHGRIRLSGLSPCAGTDPAGLQAPAPGRVGRAAPHGLHTSIDELRR